MVGKSNFYSPFSVCFISWTIWESHLSFAETMECAVQVMRGLTLSSLSFVFSASMLKIHAKKKKSITPKEDRGESFSSAQEMLEKIN